MSRKVILIGGTGQLGSDIVTAFNHHPTDWRLLHYDGPRLEDPSGVLTFLRVRPFDAVINCAAFHKIDQCEVDATKTFAVNAHSVKAIGEACDERGAAFLTFSSDYVFGRRRPWREIGFEEGDLKAPVNIYGASKSLAEEFTFYNRGSVWRVASLFGVKGASGKGSNFVETMIKKAHNHEPLTVVDDVVMSPTSTFDVAERTIEWLNGRYRDQSVMHCVNSGKPVSWHGFAREILNQVGLDDYPIGTAAQNRAWGQVWRPPFSGLRSTTELNMPTWKEALHLYLQTKGHI